MKKYLASLAALSLLTLGLMPASALGQAPPPPTGSSNQQDDPYASCRRRHRHTAQPEERGWTGRRPRQLHSRRRFLPARRQRRLGRGHPKFSHLSRRSRGDWTEFPRGTSTRLRQYSAHVIQRNRQHYKSFAHGHSGPDRSRSRHLFRTEWQRSEFRDRYAERIHPPVGPGAVSHSGEFRRGDPGDRSPGFRRHFHAARQHARGCRDR